MNTMNQQVQALVLSIYDATLEPGLWPEILDRISDFVGAMGAMVFELGDSSYNSSIRLFNMTTNYHEASLQSYLDHHHRQEWRDQEIFTLHSRQTNEIELIGDTVLAKNRKLLERQDNVKMMMNNGIHYRAAALLNKDDITKDRFAFQFSQHQGPLNGTQQQKSQLVLPHLAKALSIRRAARPQWPEYKALPEVLNLLKVGVCILDSSRRVVTRNLEFKRQLETYDPKFRG